MPDEIAEIVLNYDFTGPRKIVFGWGRRSEAGKLASRLGRRAWVVSGLPEKVGESVLEELSDILRSAGLQCALVATIDHEPEVADVDHTAEQLRRLGAGVGDLVLAIGGGAAIDLAKAAAAMATNTESPTVRDYLEGVGRGLLLRAAPLPVMAMPTTAGTGAEATRNAVISCYDPPLKKSLRDERIQPQVALVDPALSASVPPQITAASGMDAITQLIESYISRKAQPIPQALAVQGLKLALPALADAVQNGACRPAREKMAHAALLSGLALANSGLGLAHGVAPALGIHCRVPHGLACAVMLPAALRVNRELRREELAYLAHALFPQTRGRAPEEAIDVLIAEIEALCRRVGVPERLSALGVRREQIPALVAGSRGSSMAGNPRELTDEELAALLEGML